MAGSLPGGIQGSQKLFGRQIQAELLDDLRPRIGFDERAAKDKKRRPIPANLIIDGITKQMRFADARFPEHEKAAVIHNLPALASQAGR